MSKLNLPELYSKLVKICWALVFVTLPVTSFPFFPQGVGGRTLVRPLSIYPLLLLIVLVTLPRLFTRRLPKTFLPHFAFLAAALASSIVSLAFGLDETQGISMAARVVRTVITLIIGSSLYLSIALVPDSLEDLKFALRWMYAGFGAALLWGTFQAVYILSFSPSYFKFLNSVQSWISTRRLFDDRISGMTYEPKWFSDQICFLLLPWLLSSVLTRQSLFRWRFRWITVEAILLAWSAGVLVFTYSRTGIAVLGVLAVLSLLLYRWTRPAGERPPAQPVRSRILRWLALAVVVVGIVAALYAVGSQNRYFSRFWRYWLGDRPGRKTYFEYIAFQQRFIYWETAFHIYEAYPILGVGLGNYAFYFADKLPERPYHRMPEIGRQITPLEGRDRLLTPKNMLARLLAETGLVGTFTFLAFIAAVAGCAFYLLFSPSPELKYWGIGGVLSIVVFAMTVISFDSFALPNMWVDFGILTAAAHLPLQAGKAVAAAQAARSTKGQDPSRLPKTVTETG